MDSFGGASVAMFTLAEAQRVTRKADRFDQISVAAAPGVAPAELKRRLAGTLPRSVEVETGEENTASQQEDVGEFIGFLKTAMLIFSGVSLFVAAFLIFNTFSITVAQRTREFAMLRTLGASRRQLVRSVVLEAFVIGIGASLLGLLAGIGFAPAINALFRALEIDLPNEGTVIAARTIILALVLGTVLTVLASLIPALRVTRVPPVTGLREGAVLETQRSHRLRGAIAVVMTAVGLLLMLLGVFGALSPGEAWVGIGAVAVFIGVALLSPRIVKPMASVVGKPVERFRGVSGRLARENAVRNPGRTAATAAALMIGLALVSFVTVFAAGLRGSINDAFDKTIQGDLIVTNNDGFSDISSQTTDVIRGVDGVAVASPSRYTQGNVAGNDGGLPVAGGPAHRELGAQARLARRPGLPAARPGPDRRRDRREVRSRQGARGGGHLRHGHGLRAQDRLHGPGHLLRPRRLLRRLRGLRRERSRLRRGRHRPAGAGQAGRRRQRGGRRAPTWTGR